MLVGPLIIRFSLFCRFSASFLYSCYCRYIQCATELLVNIDRAYRRPEKRPIHIKIWFSLGIMDLQNAKLRNKMYS